MARLPFPTYSMEKLFLFRRYQTQEDYRQATGQEPPPFNPNHAPKYWCDPAAKDSTRRTVVYDHALVTNSRGQAIAGPDGKPMLDVLLLPKELAATVNIPPQGTTVPGADAAEVPMPLSALSPDEELCFQFGGVVAVKNVNLFELAKEGFTGADRILLQAIARKLSV
ncbi:MAG: hypothetical protein HY822_21990 [Acidobacteria bacterium]|nr:hypothetical protein [Acidobacteriota bacterium]